MKVTLLQYDKDALDLLLMTKQTRLSFKSEELEAIRSWPMERKLEELGYMLDTIQSSWEFASYTILISGVSRAFTHQMVRTRTGSYAQQSHRTIDMSGFEFIATGGLCDASVEAGLIESTKGGEHYTVNETQLDEAQRIYRDCMCEIDAAYEKLIAAGVPPQDARGVLPTNVATAIIGKFDLRTLSQMAALRLCTRTQGEYQSVFRLMREAVIAIHPWAEPFLRVHCARHGVCAFPRYAECPIKGAIFNPDTGRRWDNTEAERPATKTEIQAAWQTIRYEAVPKSGTPR